jgi:thiol:disulfide interchange protein
MKLKKYILTLVATLIISVLTAQIFEPVKWKFKANVLNDKEAEIIASAVIEEKWHVYALKLSDKADAIGPIPTTIKLNPAPGYELQGSPQEGKYITHFDANFEMDLNYFENTAQFKQKIKIKTDKPFKVSGVVEYMACNDERCIFPDPELFELEIVPPVAAKGEVVTEPSDGEPSTASTTTTTGSASESHVSWSYSVANIGHEEYDLVLRATADEGWHIYSQKLESNEGPIPTKFTFEPDAGYSLSGMMSEPKPTRVYDKNFMMNIDYHGGVAEFRQKIKTIGGAKPIVNGTIDFMQCNDERCLPPQTVYVKFDLAAGVAMEYDPLAGESAKSFDENDPFKMNSVDLNAPVSNCGQEKVNHSLWAIFIFGIIGGLLALLTPCVFPMIPLTVSFFTKGAEKEKGKQRAVMYGFFIFLIYFVLSLPFHLSKNVDPEVLNSIATNTWLNIGFFVVFIVFAISFFGFFEITLPSGLANKVDNASNLGGLIGIFFMALTLAIVSFSCTGPILGTVIGSIYSSDLQGTVGFLGAELSMPAAKVSAAMMGFGIALGLPFALFAAFPALLKKLPKSGGWMDDFKVSLGFMEVALAVKFLSNADLVEQWGFFKRETFFAIWIVIGVMWLLYMLGLFRFKPGQGSKGMPKFKLAVTIAIAAFTLRMVPGVLPSSAWNRFDFLSGFPPPKSYSWYHYEEEFIIYKDLAEAMKVAQEQGKPLFVDFTGWACVNCRKMEDTVWPEDAVKEILSNEYVMCSLYVDEKVELPAEEQFIYTTKDGRKKQIKTVGNKWATLQTETFGNNSQPMYALLNQKGELLAPIEQYNPDADKYVSWLQCGLQAYKAGMAQSALAE